MPRRRHRLDQRSLLPRDYLTDPWQFGHGLDVAAVLPTGGDRISLQVARVQHLLVCHIRAHGASHTTATVTAAFGFSKQYWSRCLLGYTWMGETVFAAATGLLLDSPPPDL
jgi:hypothetical protein